MLSKTLSPYAYCVDKPSYIARGCAFCCAKNQHRYYYLTTVIEFGPPGAAYGLFGNGVSAPLFALIA